MYICFTVLRPICLFVRSAKSLYSLFTLFFLGSCLISPSMSLLSEHEAQLFREFSSFWYAVEVSGGTAESGKTKNKKKVIILYLFMTFTFFFFLSFPNCSLNRAWYHRYVDKLGIKYILRLRKVDINHTLYQRYTASR